MARKKKPDPSLVYCAKYDISFPFFSDILIDPPKKIHRVVLTPCPMIECDGYDETGHYCLKRVHPPKEFPGFEK